MVATMPGRLKTTCMLDTVAVLFLRYPGEYPELDKPLDDSTKENTEFFTNIHSSLFLIPDLYFPLASLPSQSQNLHGKLHMGRNRIVHIFQAI